MRDKEELIDIAYTLETLSLTDEPEQFDILVEGLDWHELCYVLTRLDWTTAESVADYLEMEDKRSQEYWRMKLEAK